MQPYFVRLAYESNILSLPKFGLSCTTGKASPTNGLVNMWTSIALVHLFSYTSQYGISDIGIDQTCKIVRAARYPRMSLFEYPHPPRSPMHKNFSSPLGILKDQDSIRMHKLQLIY